MLNPPLSLLSNELLTLIVEHLDALPYSLEAIRDLSLTDHAFTPICQNLIFRILQVGSDDVTKIRISYQLKKFQTILNEKPSAADQVRVLRLFLSQKQDEWVLKDPIFIRILDLIAKSPSTPDKLEFSGFWSKPIDNPVLFVDVLTKSFFSQSLRSLRLSSCSNLPLPLLLICPRLQVVSLDEVAVTDDSYDGYQDDQCAREWPSLQVFRYHYSHSFVEQMITPPPRFQVPLTLWSQLRILELCPYVDEDLACLQPILDAACNSLEELNLSVLCSFGTCHPLHKPKSPTNFLNTKAEQISLAGLMNLTNHSNLRVFSLIVTIDGDARNPSVLQDINTVLSRISSPNKITNMFFDFTISGSSPFLGCLDEDWVGLCQQIIRIAAGKPLELDLQMAVSNDDLEEASGEHSLYMILLDKAASLSDCPNICTHVWNGTLGELGYKAAPLGEVRTKCKR